MSAVSILSAVLLLYTVLHWLKLFDTVFLQKMFSIIIVYFVKKSSLLTSHDVDENIERITKSSFALL